MDDSALMEEEILVMRQGRNIVFNFHKGLFASLIQPLINLLEPCVTRREGDRVILILEGEKAEELKAWLMLHLEQGFYITELEDLELQ